MALGPDRPGLRFCLHHLLAVGPKVNFYFQMVIKITNLLDYYKLKEVIHKVPVTKYIYMKTCSIPLASREMQIKTK